MRSTAIPSRAVALFVAAAFAVVLAGGCEAIVPGSLPDFTCQGDAPGTCPDGYYCKSPQCVPCDAVHCAGADAGGADVTPGDARGSDADGNAASDVTSPVDSPPPVDGSGCGGALGCPCTTSADCASHICGDANVLSSAFTSTNGSVCTETCCTSADCPAGLVCYGAGTGGSYCVGATQIGRPSPGATAAGATCTAPGDCRSGDCTGGICEDSCCADSSCAAGTTCSLTQNVSGHTTFACSTHTGAAYNATCTTSGFNSACQSDVCAFGDCRPHCCGHASALAKGYHVCTLDSNGTDAYAYGDYFGTDPSTGTAAFGASCTRDTDCLSRTCNTTAQTCSDICCVDADCASYGAGFVCRPDQAGPSPLTTTYLLCVQGP